MLGIPKYPMKIPEKRLAQLAKPDIIRKRLVASLAIGQIICYSQNSDEIPYY